MINNIYDKICFLIENRNAQKLGFPLIKVDDKIIEKFKNTVKNNKNKSDSEVIKKISRNTYSGQQIYKDNYKIIVAYGYLQIFYDRKSNIIYDIQNFKPYSNKKCGRINQEIRNELNKIYKLEDK